MDAPDQFSAQHRDLLFELSLLISERRDVDEIFASFADHIRHGITFDFTSLFVVTADPHYVRSLGTQPAIWAELAPGTVVRSDIMGLDQIADLTDGGEYIPKLVDVQSSRLMAEHGFERAWVTPLIVDERVLGMLTVAKFARGPFPAEHLAFLRSAAQLLAKAVRQDLDLERANREAARAQAASDLIFALQANEPLERIFQQLPSLLRGGLDADYVGLVLDTGKEFVLGAETPPGTHEGVTATPESTAFIRRLAVGDDFIQFHPEGGLTRWLLGAGYNRGALSFLRDDGTLRGVLVLARRTPRRFDDDEQRFIALLSSILSQSLTNQRRLQQTERAEAWARTLNQVALLLNAGEDIESIFHKLVGLLDPALEMGYIGLLERIGPDTFRTVGSRPELLWPAGTEMSWEAAALGDVEAADSQILQYRVAHVTEHIPFVEALREAGMGRGISVLLQEHSESQGVLTLARASEARFTTEEEVFLGTLSVMLAQAMANRKRVAAIHTEANRNRFLSELAVLLNNGETLEAFFQSLSQEFRKVVPFFGLVLLVRGSEPGTFRVVDSAHRRAFEPAQMFREEDLGKYARERFAEGTLVVEGRTADLDGEFARRGRESGVVRAANGVIRHDGETVGYLLLGRVADTPFSAEERGFIEVVCALVGQAIANLEKEAEKEAEALRNRILSELGLLLNNGEPIDAHFERLRELLVEGVGFDFCALAVREPGQRLLRSLRSDELPGHPDETAPLDASALETVLATGAFSVQYGTEAVANGARAGMFNLGMNRAASFVLTTGSEPEGLLTVARRSPAPFTPAEMAFLDVVASLLAHAVANERRLAMTAAEAEEQAIIAAAAAAVARETDSAAIVRSLQAASSLFIPAPFASFGYLIEDGLEFPDGRGGGVRLPIGPYFRETILRGQQTLQAGTLQGAGSTEAAVEIERIGLAGHILTLAQSGGSPVGILVVGSTDPAFRPSEREARLCRLIADIVGPAMANAMAAQREREEAEVQAIVADAAAAVARESTAFSIVTCLAEPVSRFVPDAFVRFAHYEEGQVAYRNADGTRDSQPLGPYFRQAFDSGQSIVPALKTREAAGETLSRSRRARLQSHVLTRADSAGVTIGFLLIGSRDSKFVPAPRDLRLCKLIADIVGPAMANARAAERERAEAEEQRLIAEVAAIAAREGDPGALVMALQGPVRALVPRSFLAFGYIDGEEVVFPRPDGTVSRFPIDEPTARTAREGQVVWADLPPALNNLDEVRALGGQTICSTSVVSGGAMVGVLLIGSRVAGHAFDQRELRIFRLMAQIIGPAMENARASSRARQEAKEQRILALAAASVARAVEDAGLVAGLQEPVQAFIPESIATLFYNEGPHMSVFGTGAVFPTGPYLQRALLGEQTMGQIGDPELSETSAADMHRLGIQRFVNTPIIAGGEALGVLAVSTRAPGYEFSENDLRLLRMIAGFAGPAMANLRESTRRKQEAEEQRILAAAAAAVAAAPTEEALIEALREPVRGMIPAGELLFYYLEGSAAWTPGSRIRIPLGPEALKALETRQSTVEAGESTIDPERVQQLQDLGYVRWVYTTATSGGETLGIFMVVTRDASYRFSERDLRVFRLMADFAGPAMANLRESSRRKQEADEQRILAEAAAAAARATDEEALMRGLWEPFRRIIPAARLGFFVLEDGGVRLVGGPDQTFPLGPQALRTLQLGQVVGHTSDAEITDISRSYARVVGIHSWLDTAVKQADSQLGYLFVGTKDAAYEFTERDRRLCRSVADIVGPALVSIRESRRRRDDADEQRILAEAASALAAGSTEDEILAGLAGPVGGFIPGAQLGFNYVEGDEVVLYTGAHRRPIHELSRRAIETGQVEGETETSPVTDASRDLMRQFGVKRFLETAATSAGVPIGLLFVGTRDEDYHFSDRDKRIIRLIADITGPAMANAREERHRRQEAEDDRILSEVAAVAARATSSLEITQAIPAALAPLIPNAFANYGLIDGDNVVFPVIRPGTRRTLGVDEVALPMTEAGFRARSLGQAVGSPAGLGEQHTAAYGSLQHYSLTTYYSGGTPAGVLLVSTTDPDYRFSDRALALLKRMVQFVGPAVEAARAEAELARQTSLYSLILRSLSEGVVLTDIQGNIMFANELGRRILKALDPDETKTSWTEITNLLPEHTREGFTAVFEHGTGSRGRGAIPIDGRQAWFDYEIVPLNDPVMKVLFVAADVTDAVEREGEQARHREQMEQASRLAALGELIGGVAHELNNPLTAILGFAEVMSLSPEAAALSEELAIVQKEALRARNIVRDLLFIVRPGTAERSLIPVVELVAHIERLRRAVWSQQGIRWDINIEQPCSVWGNEHQLTQVILNLVTNAEHAVAGCDERRITVRARCTDGRTEISVSDTGAGMDEATKSRVFEPFFTTKQGVGTGLGLPLSYSIVQSHNGEIRVDSEPGKGTTFTIVLPAAPDTPEQPPESAEPAEAGIIRVLVVDDEPSLRKVCQRLIASMGHECVTAENSSAAIELAAQTKFDVVLCDYRLASETANDVVAGFERVAPQLIPRMVIATGATTDAGVVTLTEKYGIRLMAKPYGVDELAAIVREVGGPNG